MRRRKIKLRYKKERVILSDVLPYETPISFSNRFFYRFLVRNGIEIKDNKIFWNINMHDGAFEILKLLSNNIKGKKEDNTFDIARDRIRIPFTYNIAHKQNSFRELSIIHPLNQIDVIAFYEKYKDLILYYCNQSNFSLRKANKVARYTYYKDKLHEKLLGKKIDHKEEVEKEYENIRSYFSYKEYSNIYKFYEDYHYQRAEKKFNYLIKFDIQSCFDSIYTHSIAWATLGNKEQVKKYINQLKNTFADDFDNLMQKMNYNETNGILIGPDFSRIFAEIILQQIDKKVETDLKNGDNPLYNKKNYECYRYVDDYFVFYNNETDKEKILELFSMALRDYKMSISDAKTKLYSKPFITDITMAKIKIDSLLDDNIKFNILNKDIDIKKDESESDLDYVNTPEYDDKNFNYETILKYLFETTTLYINPNNFIAKYKSIIKETDVEYKNILNYTFARLSTKLERVINKFDDRFKYLSYYTEIVCLIDKDKYFTCMKLREKYEKEMTNFIVNILDIIFFLYSNSKRVNTTLKVVSLLNVVTLYANNKYHLKNQDIKRFHRISIETIFKKIQDEINLVFKTSTFNENLQLETLYLLIPLKELGTEYKLKSKDINHFLDRDESEWNTLLISVLLYYYSDDEEYNKGREMLKTKIKRKIEKIDDNQRYKYSEIIILVLDIIACPYLEETYKKEILSLLGIKDENKQNLMLKYTKRQKYWFTKWNDFDLNFELNAKVSQNVYS